MKKLGWISLVIAAAAVSACDSGSGSPAPSGNHSAPNLMPLGAVMCQQPLSTDDSETPPSYGPASSCQKQGGRVIDQNHTIYFVDQFFVDGRVAVFGQYGYGNQVLASGSYSPEVYQINGYSITEGSWVIDGNGISYQVNALFANGQAQLVSGGNGALSFADIRSLSQPVKSYNSRNYQFKLGETVLDSSGNEVVIVGMASDGRMLVQDRYGARRVISARDATPPVGQ